MCIPIQLLHIFKELRLAVMIPKGNCCPLHHCLYDDKEFFSFGVKIASNII